MDVELYDGSRLRIRKIAAMVLLEEAEAQGEALTGLLYVNTGQPTFLEMLPLVEEPLATLPESKTRPARAVLDQMMEELR